MSLMNVVADRLCYLKESQMSKLNDKIQILLFYVLKIYIRICNIHKQENILHPLG